MHQRRTPLAVLLVLLMALSAPAVSYAQDSDGSSIADTQQAEDSPQSDSEQGSLPVDIVATTTDAAAGMELADDGLSELIDYNVTEDVEGEYVIESYLDVRKVLDICSGSSEDGANAQLYERNGAFAQSFKLKATGDGLYQIISDASGKALMAADNSALPGTNVCQGHADVQDERTLFTVVANGDGTFSFRNVGTGLMLDIAGGSASDGANVQLASANDSDSQRFILSKVTDMLAHGAYELAPRCASDLRLDVAGGSEAEDANVQLWSSNGNLAQKWNVAKVDGSDNTYTLQSVVSGQYLSVGKGGASADVRQRGEADEAAQWVASVNAGYVTFTNRLTGLALDVAGGGQADGTNVQTYATNGADAQSFTLLPTSPLPDGWYELAFSQDENQTLDVSDGSHNSGANVQSYARNDTAAQKWYLTRQSDGSYTLVNAGSKLALDVSGSTAVSGQNVRQWEDNGSQAQRWLVTYAGGAANFDIASSLGSSLSLSAAGTPEDGQNVVILSSSEGSSPFKLVPTSYSDPSIVSDLQQRVCDSAKSTPSPGRGLCARWVSQAFRSAGLGYANGNARDMYWNYCTETDKSELRVGMIIAVPSHPHTSAGRVYGHVGIYIGDGLVMDNIGSIRTSNLDEWIAYYGATTEVRWGWLMGRSLV